MLDFTQMQRTKGAAQVELAAPEGRTRLVHLAQSGSAKAMLPRVHSDLPEVVLLNTAGGVTGGDVLRYEIDLGAGAQAVVATQTAERAYRSLGDWGRVEMRARLGPGAALALLPQEVICFDHSRLARRTRVDAAPDARLLMVDTVVLGRQAMGETLTQAELRDDREVYIEGAPVWLDRFALDESVLAAQTPALLAQQTVLASLYYRAPDAEGVLDGLRDMLTRHKGARIGASAWNGQLSLRFMGCDSFILRGAIAAAITYIWPGALPRVWRI
jgi:urease accessory protein